MLKGLVGVCIILLLFIMPAPVYATHGFGSWELTVKIDGEIFTAWGYAGDWELFSFRLKDIAYMLNGTTAQFSIREPIDDRWDFWIVRNTPHTPTGTELSPIPERHAIFGSYGFVGGYGLGPDLEQTIILGIDGDDYPALTVAISVIKDEDDLHFSFFDLANVLGYTVRAWGEEEADVVISTDPNLVAYIPYKSVEFVTLLTQIGGRWVDQVHLYAEIIDESVVWPVEFVLDQIGFREFSWTPIAPFVPRNTPHVNEWFAVSKQILDRGLVEITIDPSHQVWDWRALHWRWDDTDMQQVPTERDVRHLATHRIIVDPNQPEINELTYYIGDTAFSMVRYNLHIFGATLPNRYNVEPSDCGGIRLTYVVGNGAFWINYPDATVRIHRSYAPQEDGEILYTLSGDIDSCSRIFFEFIDPNPIPGQVYYYSIRRVSQWGGWAIMQMRVDVDEILGAPEPVMLIEEVEEEYDPTHYEPTLEEHTLEEPQTVPAMAEYPHSSRTVPIRGVVIGMIVLVIVIYLIVRK